MTLVCDIVYHFSFGLFRLRLQIGIMLFHLFSFLHQCILVKIV